MEASKPFKTDGLAGLNGAEPVKGRSLWQDARRRLFSNKAAVGSMILLGVIVILAVFAPMLSPWAFDDPDWGYDFPGPPNIETKHWFGTDLAGYAKKQLNKRGINEKMYDGYERDQANYDPLVKKLTEHQIDVVYAGGYLADIGIILRQAQKILPDIRMVSGDSLAHAEFLVVAGNAGVGTYFTFGQDMREKQSAETVVTAFREHYDYEPEGYTLYSYAAVQAWAQAVEKAASLESKPVIETLKTATFDTVLGPIGFDGKGDVTGMSPFVWYVFGDKNYMPAEPARMPK